MKYPVVTVISVSIGIIVLGVTYMWLSSAKTNENVTQTDNFEGTSLNETEPQKNETETVKITKPKILFVYKNACSVLDIFTKRPPMKCKTNYPERTDNTLAIVGISIFLVGLALNGVYDTLKANEADKLKIKMNETGERRPSLAEYANKKVVRRESSKFNLQLCQIQETPNKTEAGDSKPNRPRSCSREGSVSSFVTDQKAAEDVSGSPSRISGFAGELKFGQKSSSNNVLGHKSLEERRPSGASGPLNPDIQVLMMPHRRSSTDSDDEDGRGKRVRIIRRF